MKILSPSVMRLEKPLEICAKILNALGCKSAHIDVSMDENLPGFYTKDILSSSQLNLFNCPATVHVFPGKNFCGKSFGKVRENDRIMLHIFPHTNQKQISLFLEDSISMGYQPAIALDIESEVKNIIPFISSLKAIYIMGIPVATYGLPPDGLTKKKMGILKKIIKKHNPQCKIGIDGGINQKTFTEIATLADEIVIGGLLFNTPNIYSQWEALTVWLKKIDGGIQ